MFLSQFEMFPAGRFCTVCKLQAERGAVSTVVADIMVKQHSTHIIQVFNNVLADKMKRPSLLKPNCSFGSVHSPPHLTRGTAHPALNLLAGMPASV
ncbi:hypothetical protein B0H21DRAFT_522821 [Amylocystis lapponica]|nr:hypothetical protein B0H21DRAFT_522821 [Amylocystis lapponica]